MIHRVKLWKKFSLLMVFWLFMWGCESGSESPSSPFTQMEGETYHWFLAQQLPNGLLESTEQGGIVSLYDNALAVMVFSIHGDFHRAEAVLDWFDSRREGELNQSPGGFSQFRNAQGELDSGAHRWMGDNGWLLIAVNNYHHLSGNSRYEDLAADLESWLRSLQDEDGGLIGGYDAQGQEIHKITEGMIDSFNAVPGFDDFHRDLLTFWEASRWDREEKMLIAWPNPPKSTYKYALDMVTWGYCALQDFPVQVIDQADALMKCRQTAAAVPVALEGFSIDGDRDHVWLEGIGQMLVTYGSAGMVDKGDYYREQMEQLYLPSPHHNQGGGFPYVANIQGATFIGDGPFWEGADRNIALSSGAWYLFAARNFDPFALGRDKGIPEDELFWLD